MPGSLIKEYECSTKADVDLCMKLITDTNVMYGNEPSYLFGIKCKLKCSEDLINALPKLPLVFRHCEAINEENVIGLYILNYMVENKIHAAKHEFMLTFL